MEREHTENVDRKEGERGDERGNENRTEIRRADREEDMEEDREEDMEEDREDIERKTENKEEQPPQINNRSLVLEYASSEDSEDNIIPPVVVPIGHIRFRRHNIPLRSLEEMMEAKNFGIPCPETNTVEPIEAKEILLPCTICHTNQVQTVNFPCMHACFCISCAKPALGHSEKCPQCRTELMHVSLLYLTYKDSEPPSKKAKLE